MNLKRTISICVVLCLSKVSLAQFTGSSPIQQGSAGNVAIGFPSYTPNALLQVKNGSVLFEGTTGTTPISGVGTRMMWIPSKGAFRAGSVAASSWDESYIGIRSFAVNNSNLASGNESFGCGWANTAAGNSSFAAGNGNNVSGSCSFVAGAANSVTGVGAASFGAYNTVQAYTSFVVGQYNIAPGTYSTTSWVMTDPLFVIGNGTNTTARANALTVLKNGNIGIGNTNPTDKLSISGTLRMNNNNIFLASDPNHGLGYYDIYTTTGNYAGKHIDGPVVFGFTGGALGTNQWGNKNVALTWAANGNVGIGTFSTGAYRLAVEGKIGAREVVITNASWADFVFESNYELMPLNEIKTFIKENKHLPEIPSAIDIKENGLSIGEIQKKQMQKIEELTLYLIQQNEKIDMLEKLVKETK